MTLQVGVYIRISVAFDNVKMIESVQNQAVVQQVRELFQDDYNKVRYLYVVLLQIEIEIFVEVDDLQKVRAQLFDNKRACRFQSIARIRQRVVYQVERGYVIIVQVQIAQIVEYAGYVHRLVDYWQIVYVAWCAVDLNVFHS